jgi:hypothetical protein
MDRGERRRRTGVIVERRRRQRKLWFGDIAQLFDFNDEWGIPGRWKKTSPHCCGCRRRVRGQPRVGCGTCYWGWTHEVYKRRRDARELNQALRGLSFNKADAMITLKGV